MQKMNKKETNKVVVERVNGMELSSKVLEERNVLNPTNTANVYSFTITKGQIHKDNSIYVANATVQSEDYTDIKDVISMSDAFVSTGSNAIERCDFSFDFAVIECNDYHMDFIERYSHLGINPRNGAKVFFDKIEGSDKGIAINPKTGKVFKNESKRELILSYILKGYAMYNMTDGFMSGSKQKGFKYVMFKEVGQLKTNSILDYCDFMEKDCYKGIKKAMKNATRAALAITNSTEQMRSDVTFVIGDLTHLVKDAKGNVLLKNGKVVTNDNADGEMLVSVEFAQEQILFKGILDAYIKGDKDTLLRLAGNPMQARIIKSILDKVKAEFVSYEYLLAVIQYCMTNKEKVIAFVNSDKPEILNLSDDELIKSATVITDLNGIKQWGKYTEAKRLLEENENAEEITRFKVVGGLPINILKIGHATDACFNEPLHRLFANNLAQTMGIAGVNKLNDVLYDEACNYMEEEALKIVSTETTNLKMGSKYSMDLIESVCKSNPALFYSKTSQFSNVICKMANKVRIPYGEKGVHMQYRTATSDYGLKLGVRLLVDYEIFSAKESHELARLENKISDLKAKLSNCKDKSKNTLNKMLTKAEKQYEEYCEVHRYGALTKMPMGDNGSLAKVKILSLNEIIDRINKSNTSDKNKTLLIEMYSNPYCVNSVIVSDNKHMKSMIAGFDFDIDALLLIFFKKEHMFILDSIQYGIIEYEYAPGSDKKQTNEKAKNDASRIFASLASNAKSCIKLDDENKVYNVDEIFIKLCSVSFNIGQLTNESSVISSIMVEAIAGNTLYLDQFLYEMFEKKTGRGIKEYRGLQGAEVINETRIDELAIEFRDCCWSYESKIKFLIDLSFVFNFYQEGAIDLAKTSNLFRKIFKCLSVKIERLSKIHSVYDENQKINYLAREEFVSKQIKTSKCSARGTMGGVKINTIQLSDCCAQLQNRIIATFNELMLGQGSTKSQMNEQLREHMSYSKEVVDAVNDTLKKFSSMDDTSSFTALYNLKDTYNALVEAYREERKEILFNSEYDEEESKSIIAEAREEMLKKISGVVTLMRRVLDDVSNSTSEKGALLLGISGSILVHNSYSGALVHPTFSAYASSRMPMNVAPEYIVAFLNGDKVVKDQYVTAYGKVLNADDSAFYSLKNEKSFITVDGFIDGVSEHYILDNKYTGDGVRCYKDGHCEVEISMSSFVNTTDDVKDCDVVICVLTEELEKLLTVVNNDNKIKFANIPGKGDTMQVIDELNGKTYGKILPESAVILSSAQDNTEYNLYSYSIFEKYDYVAAKHRDNKVKKHLLLTLTK